MNALAYWTAQAGIYSEQIGCAYHEHRLAMVNRLLDNVQLDDAYVVDFGCGEGILSECLIDRGARVTAIDATEEMVARTQERLGSRAQVLHGGVEQLKGRADVIVSLNVLAYLDERDLDEFYDRAARTLRPGGTLITSHSNDLFGLYSLNGHTVDFHRRHFSSDVRGHLTSPLSEHPGFVRENPLSYADKLGRYGFKECQQEFVNLHTAPPTGHESLDREQVDTADWPAEERWKLLFQCSMFGSRAVRV